MEFYNRTGKMAIGSRLRLLSEKLTEDATQLYAMYGVDLAPKWFPVFYSLTHGDNTITAIAGEIGHSHASVSKIVSEMARKGLVTEKKDTADGRRNRVTLSAKGKRVSEKIAAQYIDVGNAVEQLTASTQNDLWKAIAEWEYLLQEQPLLERVKKLKKERESAEVQIVDYKPKYQHAFKSLNEEWIAHWFEMEDADRKVLDNPKKEILDKGGYILVALYENEPVGVCALQPMDDPDFQFELVKMGVSPAMRGKNIGWLLGTAAIEKARGAGASAIYLESNTVLEPAINLYKKLGFKKVGGRYTPYARCNIQMGLVLGSNR